MHIISFDEYKSRINKNRCSNLFNSYPWLKVLSKTYGLKFEVITGRNFFLPFSIIEDHYFKSVKLIPFSDYILNNCNKTFLAEAFDFIKEKYPEYYISASIVNRDVPVLKDFLITKKGYLNQLIFVNGKNTETGKRLMKEISATPLTTDYLLTSATILNLYEVSTNFMNI